MGVILLGKIKIHEIAKKLNLTSKEVLEVAQKLNIEAKSHLSNIEESDAEKIEKEFSGKKQASKNVTKIEEKAKETKKEKNETPVIIRREVIINEEADKKKEKEKKIEERNNKVGFVERKQNDYNIVYRNKQAKPMTVNELFGIKKEQPKQEKKEEIKEEIKEIKEVKEEKIVEIKEMTKPVTIESDTKEKNEVVVNKVESSKPNNQRNNYSNQEKNTFNKNNFNNAERNTFNNQNRGNYNNQNKNNTFNNQNRNNFNNQNRNGYNNNQRNNFDRNNGNNANGRFNNNNKFGNNKDNKFEKRPLDEKGLEKNIKNIMAVETVEKEQVREYSKAVNKQKDMNKFDDNRTPKKATKTKKGSNSEINEHKLKHLKQTDRLSNMFDDQEGGMLDYYDLTTEKVGKESC